MTKNTEPRTGKLSVTISAKVVEEETEDSIVHGVDVTCGDTTFIPAGIEEKDDKRE